MKMNQLKSFFPLLGIFMIIALPSSRSAAIDWNSVGQWALDWLRSLGTFLILGLLAIWIIPKPLNRWSESLRRAPFKSFGVGILVVIVGYAGVLLAFALVLAFGIFLITITLSDLGRAVLALGIPALGLILSALNFIIAFVSKLVVVYFLGKILLERPSPNALKNNFWPLLLGLTIYLLVRAIPWLGWAVGVVVTLVGLGAIWLGLSRSKEAVEMKATPAPEAAVENAQAEEVIAEEQAPETPQPDDVKDTLAQEIDDPGGQPSGSSDNPEIDSQAGD
jgi:hypothetical protein